MLEKLASFVVAGAFTIALVGCGGAPQTIDDPAAAGSETQNVAEPNATVDYESPYDGNTVRLYFKADKALTQGDIPVEFNATKVAEFELYEGSGFAAAYDVTMPRGGDYETFEKTADALQSAVGADARDIVDFIDDAASNYSANDAPELIGDSSDASAEVDGTAAN